MALAPSLVTFLHGHTQISSVPARSCLHSFQLIQLQEEMQYMLLPLALLFDALLS